MDVGLGVLCATGLALSKGGAFTSWRCCDSLTRVCTVHVEIVFALVGERMLCTRVQFSSEGGTQGDAGCLCWLGFWVSRLSLFCMTQ